MSDNGYLIWFIATAVMTVAVMAICVAGAEGAFSKRSRAVRHQHHEDAARLSVPRQRDESPATAQRAEERSERRTDETSASDASR